MRREERDKAHTNKPGDAYEPTNNKPNDILESFCYFDICISSLVVLYPPPSPPYPLFFSPSRVHTVSKLFQDHHKEGVVWHQLSGQCLYVR